MAVFLGVFRHARCYAPEVARFTLLPVVGAPGLALALDVDALERSAVARFDRVMLRALQALADVGVQIVLVARFEHQRAAQLQQMLPGSHQFNPHDVPVTAQLRSRLPPTTLVAITDDPALLAALHAADRGVALGRPELARDNIAVAGDAAVRAMLWWILEARAHSLAS